jgi:hypothetical protein
MHQMLSLLHRISLRSSFFPAVLGLALAASGQPVNDNPCGAVTLTPNVGCSNTTGTLASSTPTPSIPPPGCANYVGGDVWYQVTVPASGQITVTTSASGGGINTGMAFYTAPSCAGPFSLVSCNDDIIVFFNQYSRLVYNGAPGTVIYVRVWRYGSTGAGSFNICATAPPPPPANDNPCTATSLTVAANCGFTSYTNVNATTSATTPAPGCGSFAGALDVWFSFTAPATGVAIIETQAGTMTDGAMALYSAPACNGTFTLVQCDDDNGPGNMPFLSFTGLTPGNTYYLRFWGYGGTSGTFNLCVHGPTSVPAGNCVYVLQLFDSNGNGWGSSTVGIAINGGPYTTYTVTTQYNIVLIGLNIGNVIVVQYTASGPNQGQNSYNLGLLTGGGLLYSSGSPPTAGIAFTQTVTCTPPAAPANDCAGGTTICNGQSFNNNSSGTGNVADLNSSNQGCLASGERQGTWYRFSPSSSGTVGFTIAPVVTTDYDFAVWGPLAGVQCPPIGPPLRCSYSGLTGDTGVGNGAADASEGAGGDKWVSLIPVTAGQIYILYVDNFSANGQSFSLTWQLGAGASLDCTVLPIELTAFHAEASGSTVQLDWTTATESDNDLFVIERSPDGAAFEGIGVMDAIGNSQHATNYAFVDPFPLNGMNHYRLMQVDIDGRSEHSEVRTVFFRQNGGPLVMVPNPGNEAVRVLLPRSAAGAVVQVTDATGRVVLSATSSGDQVQLDTSRLRSGLYSIRAITPEGLSIAGGTWVKE